MSLWSYCFDKIVYICVVASVSMKETSKKNGIYIFKDAIKEGQ